jgi:hypothetical protein
LSALIYQRNHLFGRKLLRASFDPDARPRMRIHNEEDIVSGGSYVIFSETTMRFIGFRRGVVYHLDGSETSRRMELIFYPAGQA